MLKKLGIFLMVLAMTCSSMDILTNVAYASVEANQTEKSLIPLLPMKLLMRIL